jgi:CNT family concentrative nucleoside transporter
MQPDEKALIRPTPLRWRCGLAAVVVAAVILAYTLAEQLGPRGQSALGVIGFLSLAAVFSSNLRAVSWRTIGWGFALQVLLVLFIDRFEVFGVKPGREFFDWVGGLIKQLLAFTQDGASFVFGRLAEPKAMNEVFPPDRGFIFAFAALPTIIFIASFFSVLYYLGVLQLVVRLLARIMMVLLRTSGAETLSVTANIFMGQTEAPLIIKPYVPRMTQSELLTMMVGGMAHISGGLMAVYIGMGANAEAILATSVMAAPGSLYLSKLLLPELGNPETRGEVRAVVERTHVNVIDAAAAGASDGLRLALNIAAMLIAFLAFIALFNALLGAVVPGLSLQKIFSWLFAPIAVLLGVQGPEQIAAVADLLGKKLVANEFVAYVELVREYRETLPRNSRAFILTTYALTGFANFASIGIQIGGIGAMAPERRPDLARLGPRALLVGFLVTLVNASIAGMILSFPEADA